VVSSATSLPFELSVGVLDPLSTQGRCAGFELPPLLVVTPGDLFAAACDIDFFFATDESA
jgi:hypothetical protein